MRLHGRVCYLICDEARFGHMVGVSKTFVGIAEDVMIVLLEIAWFVVVNEVGLGLHRLFRIEVSRKHFVVHIDEFQRLLNNALPRTYDEWGEFHAKKAADVLAEGNGVLRLTGMCECSPSQIDSKPVSSTSCPSRTGDRAKSAGIIVIPNFIDTPQRIIG